MRKEFTGWLERAIIRQTKLIFLTGDLGFQAFEKVQAIAGDRFVNMGVAEQNMVSVAASMAHEGLSPWCYSIAPFAVFRPAEQIRLDVCLHSKNVTVVGNGGGYGYGIMGATHHAIEDLACLTSYQNLRAYIPYCNEDVESVCEAILLRQGPSYLRLGSGKNPEGLNVEAFAPIRQLNSGNAVTIVALGPIVLEAIQAVRASGISADIFVVSEMPLLKLSADLVASIQKTKRLVVLEEHVQRGGLGEHLALKFLAEGISAPCFTHRYALGYPSKRYGSQAFHRAESGLDAKSIAEVFDKWKT